MVQIMGCSWNVATFLWLIALNAPLSRSQSLSAQAYTPVAGACPSNFTLVRAAGSSSGNQTLSSAEESYIQARRSQVIPQAWKEYLANVEKTNVTLPSYVSGILNGSISQSPNFGIAASGGGNRAAIFGAGVLSALDGRNASANNAGLGGLLQAATYLTALSGGSWLVASLAQANFPTIEELVFGYPDLVADDNSWGSWNANFSVYAPSGNAITDAEYLVDLFEEIKGKNSAGFPVTLADYWGRILARHFVNGTFPSNFLDESYTHGAGILLSSLAESDLFASYSFPFPIFVANLFEANQNSSNIISAENFVPISNPIMEFNVYEMGSFDPMLSAFTPTEYLGTRNSSVCVTNYDQLSFVMATSSELWNELNATGTLASRFGTLLSSLSNLVQPGIELDGAAWPNAFYGVEQGTFLASNQTNLNIVDGGEDGEAIPLQPLLVKARDVDVIMAIDAYTDVNNFAAGSSLIATKNRTNLLSSAYSFPPVPATVQEFVARNLSQRPTFFGCNTTSANQSTPLVIYLANGGPPRNGDPPLTNTSVYQAVYDLSEVRGMLDQSFVVATQGYPADPSKLTDPEWPACLACAIVDRARQRAGEERSGVCKSCFGRYCAAGAETLTGAKNVGAGTKRFQAASAFQLIGCLFSFFVFFLMLV